jgi:porin
MDADMTKFILPVAVFLSIVNFTMAEKKESKLSKFMHDLNQQQTLTNGFFGLDQKLYDYGIELELGITRIYQQNTRGGISTHRQAGRHSGSYDLLISSDLQKLLGLEAARLFVHAEGRWSKSGSINEPSVGSYFGVNADGGPRRSIDVTELWYEQAMLDRALLLRIGKMDLTGGFEHSNCPVAFDCSLFANDETRQFLNPALVNNPTIPFPDYALGLAGFYSPIKWWYASAGVVDAQNDFRETGFSTTFHDEDYFFYIFETGITPRMDSANGPLIGAYRLGFWNDPQPKAHSDSIRKYRDDVGFYLSFDQTMTKENPEPNDSQGLGVFCRYGYANGRTNDITNFWSIGFQYQGLIEGRDDDVLGVGFAQGIFSNGASMTYSEDHEDALELYYDIRFSPWMNFSTGLQYIANPGGVKGVSDAVVLEMRTQMFF